MNNQIVIYTGRFQPFHKCHYATYIHLCKKFGKQNVFICTSNKTQKNSPFNFIQKKQIMNIMFNIPLSNIILCNNGYKPIELFSKFNSSDTSAIFVVGQKDQSRLLHGNYFKKYDQKQSNLGFDKVGYVYIAPLQTLSINGKIVSGTLIRQIFSNQKYDNVVKQKLFKQLYNNKFNKNVFQLFMLKLSNNILEQMSSQTSKILNIITIGCFPIVQKQFLGLANNSKCTMLHYTNLKGIKYLSQCSPKTTVCTTDSSKFIYMDGIGTTGGYVCTLQGYPIFYFDGDAYTFKDVNGCRWFNFQTLMQYSAKYRSVLGKLLNQFMDNLIQFSQKFGDEKSKGLLGLITKKLHSDSTQNINKFISQFFHDVQMPFFNKYRKQFQEIFKYQKSKLKKSSVGSNENYLNQILLIKCKIKSVGIHDIDEQKKDLVKKIINVPIYDIHDQGDLDSFANKGVQQNKEMLQQINGKTGFIINLISSYLFPISSKQFLSLANNSKCTMLHYTNEEGLKQIIRMSNSSSNKPICTTDSKQFNYLKGGVGTSGGFVCALQGYPIFYFDQDAFTKLDNTGRRWFSFGSLIKYSSDENANKLRFLYEKFKGTVQSFVRKFDQNKRRYIYEIIDDLWQEDQTMLGKLIEQYFNKIQPQFFNKYKKQFQEIFKYQKSKLKNKSIQNEIESSVNQILLIRYKIKSIGTYKQTSVNFGNIPTVHITDQSTMNVFGNNYIIQNKNNYTRHMLIEGGAGQHMLHPFQDNNLTFNDFRTLVTRCLSGKLSVQDDISIKLDGQNIFCSWKGGKLIAARNKGQLKGFGQNALDKNQLKNMFNGRGAIQDAFYFAVTDLQNALRNLNYKQLSNVFKQGQRYMNIQIIYPETANVIPYDSPMLVFHNITTVDKDGNKISVDKKPAYNIAKLLTKVNSDVQKHFKINGPVAVQIPKNQNYAEKRPYFINKINNLQKEYGLKGTDTIGNYHLTKFKKIIKNKANILSYMIDDKLLNDIATRWAFNDKSIKITDIYKRIDNGVFKDWVNITDKQDYTKIYKQSVWPFEHIFLELGVQILKSLGSYMLANPDVAIQRLRDEVLKTADLIRQSNDINTINKLEIQLNKLKSIGGLQAIIPTQGIVFKYKGKQYKIVGAFASINQILGMLKYI